MQLKTMKDEIVRVLEQTSPALSEKEIIEQSDCYVFHDNKVITFNDEIACFVEFDTQGLVAAVKGRLLRDLISTMEEDKSITLEVVDGKFKVKGRRKATEILMQDKIILPVDEIEKPEKWRSLPDGFGDALAVVVRCADIRQGDKSLNYVHVLPDYMEACDNDQYCRWVLPVKIKAPVLIKRSAAKAISDIDPVKISDTRNWIHFRSRGGQIISARKYVDDYVDWSEIVDKPVGRPVDFPTSLIETMRRIRLVVKDSEEEDPKVVISLTKKEVTLTAEGANVRHTERKKTTYTGPDIRFSTSPAVIETIIAQQETVHVSEDETAMLVRAGGYTYIASLERID